MSIDWPDVERALCRIPHVTRAHVVPDERDSVLELHIVATPGKHPKQVVRDVQSLVRAAFGVEVDRNVVSVVQLEEEGTPASAPAQDLQPAPDGRTLLVGMTLQSQHGSSSVSVVLSRDQRRATGGSHRSSTAVGLHRMAAEATLAALVELHPGLPSSDVDGVEVRPLGVRRVALVSLAHRMSGAEDVLIGTATVRAAGELDAVARAVLDAVNRRLRT
ncbi:MAG: hypothetical protein JWM62_729 [Frankiales bacterium]|jgi:hypothetical protein|nr:hypothetical protein [Frankiales bacterium]